MSNKKLGIKDKVRAKTLGYIMTALGLVAALAWNEAIKELIAFIFPGGKDGLIPKFIYAIVVTILIVVVTVFLTKLQEHVEEEELKK